MSEKYDQDSLMKQAQNIWTMLDEMAEKDPQAYRKFIDQKTKEGKEYMRPPQPHMCVQTRMLEPDTMPYFINFCSWNRVPAPKSSEDAVPVGGTAIFSDTDEDKFSYQYSAVAFNPKILEEYGLDTKHPNDRDTLVQLAIDYIHNQHKVELSRNYRLLDKNTTHKGSLTKLKKAFMGKSEEDFDDQISELEKNFGPLGPGAKDTLLGQLSNLSTDGATDVRKSGSDGLIGDLAGVKISTETKKTGLIQELGTEKNAENVGVNDRCVLPSPKYTLEVKDEGQRSFLILVELPGVLSVGECELDISEDDLELEVPEKFFLHLKLPQEIQDSKAKAKFIKSSSCLKLELPIKE